MSNLNISVLPAANRQPSMVFIYKSHCMPSLPSVQVSQFSTFSSFNFISRSTILPQFSSSTIPINRLQLHSLSLSSSPSPSPLEISSNGRSFEVAYLINTFGWPPDVAILKAKQLKIKNPVKPDRVLAFLKRHKFTDSDISSLVKELPRILVCNPEKSLLPKFGFLSSIGLSTTDIIDVFIKAPIIIVRSLEKIMIPNFDLLCRLFNSYDEAVKVVKRSPMFLAHLNKLDMQILLEAGVPVDNILDFMSRGDRYRYPIPTPDNFRKMVEQVREMGFDPYSLKFLQALVSIMVISKSTWEDKVQVFKKYGWSDHEISFAFKKLPYFILVSKDKVEGVMDFLVNTMGIEATEVSNFPRIFSLSFEKRTIPRCLVYLSILEKGLCREFDIKMLTISEANFIIMFIKRYENEAPELWDLYKGLMKLHCLSLSSPSPSPFSVFEFISNEHSFKVSYLMSRFGWPPELAIVKAKFLRFKTLEIPERILAFLNNFGFTKTQISIIVKRMPALLHKNPGKILMPKFEFLSSLGLSITEIISVVTKAPEILERSLEKVIIPNFEILCKLVNSDEEAVNMIKGYPNILRTYLEADKIQTLLNAGVPAANIIAFLSFRTIHFTPPTPDNFRKMVEEIKEMGFDPCTMRFLEALRWIKLTSKSTWEAKVRVLKKHGWSDRDILLALEKYPVFISTSADKIERVMDFLANKMGFEARDVSNCPSVFKLSLEKTIIPRSLVYKSLLEKGLLKKKLSLGYILMATKAKFLARFIILYEDDVPELWDLYNGKLKNGV